MRRSSMSRVAVILLVFAGAVLSSPTASSAEDCPITNGSIIVTQCRDAQDNVAIPDDGISDKTAIQYAIDKIHAAGGGSVFFPAGEYRAEGLIHRSHVRLHGPDVSPPTAKIKREGSLDLPLIAGEETPLQGSINNGTSAFTVQNATGVQIGDQIAIRGAESPSPNQKTTLSSPLLQGQTQTFIVQSGFGFNEHGGYLRIGNEIVEFNPSSPGSRVMTTVRRGLYGTTTPAVHNTNTAVSQLRTLYADVSDVNGNTITINTTAKFKVTNAPAWAGAVDVTVEDLELDGSRPAPQNASPLDYAKARDVLIKDCVIRNGHHGGVHFREGTKDSTIDNCTFLDIGNVAGGLGSDVWVFHAAHHNTIKNSWFTNTVPTNGGSNGGIFIDDRTIGSTEWDGDVHHNVVDNNRVDLHDIGQEAVMAIAVSGGTFNEITNNDINIGTGTSTVYGVRLITDDGQASHPIVAANNTVTGNELAGVFRGLSTDLANDNTITGNHIYSVRIPNGVSCVDGGANNTFIGHNTTSPGVPSC